MKRQHCPSRDSPFPSPTTAFPHGPLPTAFTGGFKADPVDPHGRKSRALFGPSLTAFGQPGAGGSHAFADPENGISFAYVMNQMELGILPNRKEMELVAGVYG